MENIVEFNFEILANDRSKRFNQKSYLIWFTGLSGSGKSTLANGLEKKLFNDNFFTYSLDGDNIRKGISKNLSFSDEDRSENIRRIGEVAKLMLDAGLIVCASFVSPFSKDRELVKEIVGKEKFIEIFVSTPFEICEKRDVKGLYLKARNGEIKNFTGLTSSYEQPTNPDLKIDTSKLNIEESVNKIYNHIKSKLK